MINTEVQKRWGDTDAYKEYVEKTKKVIFYSRQVVGKLVFKILSNLGRIIFLKFFRKTLLKLPFSPATTGRDFFCAYSPKRQSHRHSIIIGLVNAPVQSDM